MPQLKKKKKRFGIAEFINQNTFEKKKCGRALPRRIGLGLVQHFVRPD